jgi:hypothetical protein
MWNARGGSSAFVPPVIAHDFAGGVIKVVETQTAGLGPDSPTPEAVSAEATCGATPSSEDGLIGCDRTNRSCSPKTDNPRLGILDQTSSQGIWNDLTWRKGIIRLLNICPARY